MTVMKALFVSMVYILFHDIVMTSATWESIFGLNDLPLQ